LAQLAVPIASNGAIVWTGVPFTFTKAGFTDPAQPENQDRLTQNVWLTRGATKGLYNAKSETVFTSFLSPRDTEWANGTTANFSTLSYTDWETWAKSNGGPPSTIGVAAVVHLKSEDIYVDIKFTSWGSGSGQGGGFTYTRSTPSAGNQPPTVAITAPTDASTFTAPTSFQLVAQASDSDGSVTNVQFFQGSSSLGNAASNPFVVALTNLAVGDYSFSAVATDNGGLSATNTISIHVVAPFAITQSTCHFAPPAQFQFSYQAQVGRTYFVLRSTNLSTWSVIATNTATDSSVLFVDHDASASPSLYRVQLLGNP
jgi:hypothetical protein